MPSVRPVCSAKLSGKFALTPLKMTENHKRYVDALSNPAARIVLCTGPPGTTKTLSAVAEGVRALRRGDIRCMLVTRPMIPVDSENVAPVTGDAHAQLSPYLTHCMGMLSCAYDEAVLEKLIDAGSIRFVPLGLLRGATFLHEYVVADEMQNASVAQFRMLLTRMGEGSRLIITGDIAQHDQHGQVSGLADFVARLSKVGEVQSIRHVELTASDVVRDDVVREVLRIYDTS